MLSESAEGGPSDTWDSRSQILRCDRSARLLGTSESFNLGIRFTATNM